MSDRFCSWCGRQLDVTQVQTGFDRDTGEPVYRERQRCPRFDIPLWRQVTLVYGGRGDPHTSTVGLMREEWR